MTRDGFTISNGLDEKSATRCETISVNGKRRHSLYHGKSATSETLLFAGPIVAVGGFLVSRLVPRHPTSTIFPREISRLIERHPRAESTFLFLLSSSSSSSPLFFKSRKRETLLSTPSSLSLLRFIARSIHKIALKRLNGAFVSPRPTHPSSILPPPFVDRSSGEIFSFFPSATGGTNLKPS